MLYFCSPPSLQSKKANKFAKHMSSCDIDSVTHIAIFVSVKNEQNVVVYSMVIIQKDTMLMCNRFHFKVYSEFCGRLNAGLQHAIDESDRKSALYAQARADKRLNLTFPPVKSHEMSAPASHSSQNYSFSGWSDSPVSINVITTTYSKREPA